MKKKRKAPHPRKGYYETDIFKLRCALFAAKNALEFRGVFEKWLCCKCTYSAGSYPPETENRSVCTRHAALALIEKTLDD